MVLLGLFMVAKFLINPFPDINDIMSYLEQWFGSEMETVLALLTDEHDVFICGSGIEGLNTEYSGNMRLVPTPIIF